MTALDWFSRCALAAAFVLLVLYVISNNADHVAWMAGLAVVGILGLIIVERGGRTG